MIGESTPVAAVSADRPRDRFPSIVSSRATAKAMPGRLSDRRFRLAGLLDRRCLVFLGGAVLRCSASASRKPLTAAMMWVVFGAHFAGRLRLPLRAAWRRRPRDGRLIPGHVIGARPNGRGCPRAGGDFDINAQINGARIAMVLDTGASSVVLTREDAKAAGLPLEVLDYTVSIDTANGRTRAAPVRSTASPSAAWSSVRSRRWWRNQVSSRPACSA